MMGAEPSQPATWFRARHCSHVIAGLELLTAAPRKRAADAGEIAARAGSGAGWRRTMAADHGYHAALIINARLSLPWAQAVATVIVMDAAAVVRKRKMWT